MNEHDGCQKEVILKGHSRTLGPTAAMLLAGLVWGLSQKESPIVDFDCKKWFCQNLRDLSFGLGLTKFELMGAQKKLKKEGLIDATARYNSTLWLINLPKYARFNEFVDALDYASDEATFPLWEVWKKEHSAISKEFGHLISEKSRFGKFFGVV